MAIPAFDVLGGFEGRDVAFQEFRGHVLADIDGDGNLEIVVIGVSDSGPANIWGQPATRAEIRVFDHRPELTPPRQLVQRHRQLWDGGGVSSRYTSTSATYDCVFAVDTDGDGKHDLVTGGTTRQEVRAVGGVSVVAAGRLRVMSWHAGRGEFVVAREFGWTPRPFDYAEIKDVWVADADNDGQPEIVCAGEAGFDGLAGTCAWIAVFDYGLTHLKGYYSWPFRQGLHRYVAGLAVADIDADAVPEVLTLTGLMSSPSFTAATNIEAELTAWKLRPDDNGLRFLRLDAVTWSGHRGWSRPTSLWAGELDRETGVEIVAGGSQRLAPPHGDSIATDIRFWRFAGGRFVKHTNFEGFTFTDRNDIPLHYSDCRSLYGADIDADGYRELLFVNDMAGTNEITGGYLVAADPNVNLQLAAPEDMFKRTLTFAVTWPDDSDAKLFAATVSAGDLTRSGRVTTIVSGTFTHYPESGGIVFAFG